MNRNTHKYVYAQVCELTFVGTFLTCIRDFWNTGETFWKHVSLTLTCLKDRNEKVFLVWFARMNLIQLFAKKTNMKLEWNAFMLSTVKFPDKFGSRSKTWIFVRLMCVTLETKQKYPPSNGTTIGVRLFMHDSVYSDARQKHTRRNN